MSVWVAALIVAPSILLVILVMMLWRRPHVLMGETMPALILAAHPDDCVILAGAYAIRAREEERRVQVAYLTCGAPDADSPRAKVRRQESLAAWGMLAVPPEDLFFFKLPEHPLQGPSSRTDADLEEARAWIEGLLRKLPQRGVVFLPAPGEAHIDHRALRGIALEAWQRSKRADLVFLEGPEYNDFLSILQAPEKALRVMIAGIPLLSRLAAGRPPAWTGFAAGGPYWTLPHSESRLAKRREMLRAFASENGDLLVHLFGWFERYRPVSDPACGLAEEPPRGYVMLGGRRRGASVFVAMAVLAEGLALVAAGLARLAIHGMAEGASWMRIAVVVVACTTFLLGARGKTSVDARVFYWAMSVGGIVGAVR
jgi:LmbE family N-acetylglucosaminyl deacetylase